MAAAKIELDYSGQSEILSHERRALLTATRRSASRRLSAIFTLFISRRSSAAASENGYFLSLRTRSLSDASDFMRSVLSAHYIITSAPLNIFFKIYTRAFLAGS